MCTVQRIRGLRHNSSQRKVNETATDHINVVAGTVFLYLWIDSNETKIEERDDHEKIENRHLKEKRNQRDFTKIFEFKTTFKSALKKIDPKNTFVVTD